MINNKILIIGGSGLLGSCFKKAFPKKAFSVGRSQINDFVIKDNIVNTLEEVSSPNDLIVHSAWDINLQNWELDKNLRGYFKNFSKKIFNFSKTRKVKCIFISSDQVYSGKGPHKEDSVTAPLNNYGKVKLECEEIAIKRYKMYFMEGMRSS